MADEAVDDDVIASVADTARWKGQVYAVPFNSDVGLLYYRRDYLSRAPTGESTDRMPRDAAGRPGYARGILLPALQRAVSRPRTPLYGAFTQTFTAQLGALFTDDPPSDAVLADRLDEALRRALPG
ncbi:hypothetical protein ACIQMV_17275 [Streptomyces sp. NPDC091412]|uniref:hypothetical protein n=1 Tax=Streptomyces sp. NPDC091412 TaxID=3366002 RepID=UPI003815CFB9